MEESEQNALAALPPGKNSSTHWIWDSVDPKPIFSFRIRDESLPSARIRNPDILSRSLVAMQAALWELWNKITSCILYMRNSRLRKNLLKYEIP